MMMCMKANSKVGKPMEKGLIDIQMETGMKGIGLMIFNMVMEFKFYLMELNMKDLLNKG